MDKNDDSTSVEIKGGAFQVARKIFESELWLYKPCSWKVIWIYILGKVNHKTKAGFERGEGYFNFSQLRDDIGKDITTDMIKSFLQYARKSSMIDTRRTTRGLRLKVLKYNTYQTIDNYVTTKQTTSKPRVNHDRTTTINKNEKNDKKEKNNTIQAEPSSAIIKEDMSNYKKEGADIIKSFESLNPACKRMYGNKTQRQACDDLIENYGLERIISVVEKTLPKTNKIEFMPTIITPLQLFQKWSGLEAGIMKLKSKGLKEQEKTSSKVAF